MNNITRLAIGIAATGAILGAPVIPQEMRWIQSYETVQFNTQDGDLGMDEYAVKGEGEWFVRTVPKENGQFGSTNSFDDLKGKKEVEVVCERCAYYSEFSTRKGERVRVPYEADKYQALKEVKNAPQPKRTEFINTLDASSAEAAFSYGSVTASDDSLNVSSISFSHTTAAGTNAWLFVGYGGFINNCGSISTLTYNSDSMSLVKASGCDTAADNYSEIWGLANPDTGSSYTVAITFAQANNSGRAHAVAIYGVKQSGSTGATAGHFKSSGDNNISTSLTTTVTNSIVIASAATGDANNGGVAAMGTQSSFWLADMDTTRTAMGGYEAAPTITSYTLGWTADSSGGRFASIAMAEVLAAPDDPISITSDVIFFE